ncbi:MAG TPA: ribbon-helix-helix protein, CopG family, partial [Nevskiaceae bacterium]|nr:ribbon-helix-helix protein, CopG family [Nevskiaceae bacterium]
MNFSIHLDDDTVARLAVAVEQTGQTRNRLIGAAIQEWLARFEAQDWPPRLQRFLANPAPEPGEERVAFEPWTGA